MKGCPIMQETIRKSKNLDAKTIALRYFCGYSLDRLAKDVQYSISCPYSVALAYARAVVLHHYFIGDDSNAPI